MRFLGDSAAGLHRDSRALLEVDLRSDSCGDCQSDSPAESHRGLKAELRRDLQRDFRCGFDRDLWAEPEGTTDALPDRGRRGQHRWTRIANQQTHCPTGASVAKSEARSESAECRTSGHSDFCSLASSFCLRPWLPEVNSGFPAALRYLWPQWFSFARFSADALPI
jgi:hypothetical protein